ncbi:hypothetical protein CPB86DRAFT_743265 [Serendipita vermifera]|nr:hypothetical protein CPB86DRAFT_743265 [Serendipita vermifera]
MPATVLGDIIERKPTAQPSHSNNLSHKSDALTGFPKATHRSESAFAKARANRNQAASNVVPVIKTGDISGTQEIKSPTPTHIRAAESPVPTKPAPKNGEDDSDWRKAMERENSQLIETMSEAERAKEREDLISQFGPDLVNLINKMGERKKGPLEAISAPPRPKSAMAHSRPSTAESTASNKSVRRLRFSDEPAKVHVYESEPSSPKRVMALLPPPTSEDSDVVQIQPPKIWKVNPEPVVSSTAQDNPVTGLVDESTPESLREKYFPNEPPPSQNPTLAWLMPTDEGKAMEAPSTSSSEIIRYDLQGRPIPPHLTKQLPVYLGLHHHGDSPSDAGYTLDELLMLSHSTLPAQRATMLQVLARLVNRVSKGNVDERENNILDDMLKKCIIVAIEAFADRSSAPVRAAGLEILWQGFVGESSRPSRAEKKTESASLSLEELPMDHFFAGLQFCVARTAPSSNFLVQTLEVLKAICSLSAKFAEEIVTAPDLLEGFIRCINSLRTSGLDSNLLIGQASVALLELLKLVVITSRKCAQALVPDISDSFLRNIAELVSTFSQQLESISISVVSSILDLYALLGRYGLGSAIASSAHELFQRLEKLVTDDIDLAKSRPLVRSWLGLLEIWIACAVNPHHTTPPHDILWSRLVAWDWSEALFRLRSRLIEGGIKDNAIWSHWWRTWTMWLQGCRLNAPDAGSEERSRWIELSSSSWGEGGLEKAVFEGAIGFLRKPHLSAHLDANSVNLASVCLAGLLLTIELGEESRLYSMTLISSMDETLRALLDQSVWEVLHRTYETNKLRIWTNLLTSILRFLRTKSSNLHPPIPLEYYYQALIHLQCGDEIQASEIISNILTATFIEDKNSVGFQGDIWTKSGGPVNILLPLYRYALWPLEDYFVGPIIPYPSALSMTTTLSPDNDKAVMKTPSGGILGIILPLAKESDWLSAPLDILLRSGSTHSRLFKTLPREWSASESDVVSSLLLLLLKRRVAMSRNHVIFTCMKVFMLEHDQENSREGEVFRDPLVDRLMKTLLEPLKLSHPIQETESISISFLSEEKPTLEEVASAFLGNDQPFYQFYSDLVGLYDSISFGHSTFGALLLSPTSQRYSKDYRKLLFGDQLPMLRSIRLEVEDVFCDLQELKDWLWPVEALHDAEILGIYVKALLKGHLSGFLKFISIHQVAYCIWPDLLGTSDERGKHQAANVLKALLTTPDEDLLQNILHYLQNDKDQSAIIPPKCYQISSSFVASRIDWAASVCGEGARRRLLSV